MAITISYNYTYQLYKQASRLNIYSRLRSKITFMLVYLVFPVASVFFFATSWLYSENEYSIYRDLWILLGWVLGLPAMILWIVRFISMRLQYRNSLPGKHPNKVVSCCLDEDGVHYEFEGLSHSDLSWDAFCGYTKNDQIALLSITRLQFLCLPLTDLSSDQQYALNSLLQTNVGAQKC